MTPITATLTLADAARRWDLIVVGAGPAGSLAAGLLARSGQSVLLIDRQPFPRWKVCGGCVNAEALATLDEAGLLQTVRQLPSVPIRQFTLWSGRHRASVPLPEGMAVSRTLFDATLLRAAIAAGAEFLPQTTGTLAGLSCTGRRVQIQQRGRAARVAVGRVALIASGLSGQRHSAHSEFSRRTATGARIGLGATAAICPESVRAGTIYMAVGRGGYVGLVRVGHGQLNMAAAVDPVYLRRQGGVQQAIGRLLRETGLPALQPQIHWQGTCGLTQRTVPVASTGVFVLGDAAGYVEPFTGEGIAWALNCGLQIVPIARRGVRKWTVDLPGAWARIYHAAAGRRQRVCRCITTTLRHPALVCAGVSALGCFPALAGPIVRRLHAAGGRA